MVVVEVDVEAGAETVERVGGVFAGDVTGVVDRADICDSLEVDTNSLYEKRKQSVKGSPTVVRSLFSGLLENGILTLRFRSSSSSGADRQLAC